MADTAHEAPAPVAARGTDPGPRRRARVDGWLVGFTALAAAVRLWGLGAQSLWYDEWLTTEATRGGLRDLVHHVATREGITPPYFLVMWGWVRLFGDGEVALRSLSVLAGVATVPVAYAMVGALGRRRGARLAAALVAVNPMLVWYSQEARPYSLLALLGALSALACVRARAAGAGRRDLGWWALAAAAVVAVHYFAAFLVAAEAVALAAAHRDRWRAVALACLPTAAVGLVLAPVALEQQSHAANRNWIAAFTLTSRVQEAGRRALLGPSLPADRLWWVAAAVVAVAAGLVLVRGSRAERAAAGLLAALGGAAVVVPLAVSVVGVDVFLGRYLVAGLVPLIGAVAVGLGVPRPPAVGLVAAATLAAVSLIVVVTVQTDPELQRPDWRAVAAAVDADRGAGAVLVVNVNGGQSSPLARYLPAGARRLGAREHVRVDRIDVLVGLPADRPCNMFVGRACGMVFLGAPLPPDVAAAVTLDRRVDLDPFAVERYRADAPVDVTVARLLAPADPAGAAVWVVPG